MIRKVIEIDEEKCSGCGICVDACHEGAIGLVNGKARLLRDDYCDGLGDCLPTCPEDAIKFIEREAADYDADAVALNKKLKKEETHKKMTQTFDGCPGSKVMDLRNNQNTSRAESISSRFSMPGRLQQWPVQIKLVPETAQFFDGCDLLIAADCTAYAYGNFHEDFIKGRVVLVGCPKLDEGDYSQKLGNILKLNDVKTVTLTRMMVPCCGGLEMAAKTAIEESGKDIPLEIATIAPDGAILEIRKI